MCLANSLPILFVGPTGTGKSAIVLDHLISMPRDRFVPNVLNFSARTTSMMVILFRLSNVIKNVFLDSRDCDVEVG